MADQRFCANCGSPAAQSDNFCTNCGQRIERGSRAISEARPSAAEDVGVSDPALDAEVLSAVTYPVAIPNRFALSRLAARWLDMSLFGFLVAFAFRLFGLQESSLTGATLLSVLVVYPFVEGPITRSFKTTIGKRLLNIQLVERTKGAPLSDYNGRALSAHFHGFAGGFPFLNLYMAWVSWRRFLETGRTSWDDVSPIYALPQGAGFIRWMGFILAVLVLLFLSALAQNISA